MIFTGRPNSLAAIAAVTISSASVRRPKKPPRYCWWITTLAGSTPTASAIRGTQRVAHCVPTNMWYVPSCSVATQFIGSMQAWARILVVYSASWTSEEALKPASTSPSRTKATPAFLSSISFRDSFKRLSLLTSAKGPCSQSTSIAAAAESTACFVSAIARA